jgi:hypothetical protein
MKYAGLSLAFVAGTLSIAAPAFSADPVVYSSISDTSSSNVNALYCSQCFYDSSKVTDTFSIDGSYDISSVNLWIYASGGLDAVTSEGYTFKIANSDGDTIFSQKVYPLSILASRQGVFGMEDQVGGNLSGLSLTSGTYTVSFFTDYSETGDQMAILGFVGGNGSYTGNDVANGGTKTGNAAYQLLGTETRTSDTTGAVPEPASWAMMIAGFGLVGATMRRRRTAVTFA